MNILLLSVLAIILVISIASHLKAVILSFMIREMERVHEVVTCKMISGTWFTKEKLSTFSCRWPFVNWYLKAMWEDGFLNIRNKHDKIKFSLDSRLHQRLVFDWVFMKNHEFQYIRRDLDRKDPLVPTRPISSEQLKHGVPSRNLTYA